MMLISFRFLWVVLQLQNLCNPRMMFESDVLRELGRLPKELGDLWSTIYKEVNSTGETASRIANTALQWLLCAQGRLSATDFITAVSFDTTGKAVHVSTSKFLGICGNLVVLDAELDVFRFTHLSVREFLESRTDFAPKIMHATAAEICLNTLLSRDWLSSEITWQKATLYQYATLYWASHIESCGSDYTRSKIGDALNQMFTKDDRVTPWFAKWLLQVESASKTLGWDDPLKEKIEQSLSHPETCLFTACTFGFSDVAEQLSKTSPPAVKRVNARGATGLHLASQFGHLQIVKILLDTGVEIDAKDDGMETALARACSAGYEEIVALLLSRGADRKVQGKKYGTALQAASLHGHMEIVIRLLDGVDVEAEGGQFGTALQAASLRGHDKVVRVLLDKGAQVNALGGEYAETQELSPGKPSNANGVRRVIEFLLQQQALLDKGDPTAFSPQIQHETIVQLLLDGGIDINIQRGGFGPALHAASRGGHEKVVCTLLDAGADIAAEGGKYGSALQAAAVSGSDKVVQLLINSGADVNVQCGVYNTALQAACRHQHEKVIQILLAVQADVHAQGGVYGSALQAAARTGSRRIMQLLLDHGADVNAQGGTYCTPLQAASAEGFDQIVQMLLERGVRISLVFCSGILSNKVLLKLQVLLPQRAYDDSDTYIAVYLNISSFLSEY
jgi:ankyrin repeat protein